MKRGWLIVAFTAFLVVDLVLGFIYLKKSRQRYPFLKSCPIDKPFCLAGQTLKFPKGSAVGYRLRSGQPFYAVADGILANVSVGSGRHRAKGYILRTDSGIEIDYTFPVDTKVLPDEEPADRLFKSKEDVLGRKVKAGQLIGWMGLGQLEEKLYGQNNLVIGLTKPGRIYQFPPLKAEDLWGL